MTELKEISRLEAVLFLAREPLPIKRLVQLADLPNLSAARALIKELNSRYERESTAFTVVEVGGGFQLRTRPEFAPWLFRLQEVPVEVRLSPSAMETLSIIAHKQPILRATIESIRGVRCGDFLKQLLDLDLIRIVGRSEELGRPFLYGTTKRFLQVFGLVRIEDLSCPNGESESSFEHDASVEST